MNSDELYRLLPPARQAQVQAIAQRWADWLDDPVHTTPPSRKANSTRLREWKARTAKQQLTHQAKLELGTAKRAEVELATLALESRLDPDPGSRASGHFAWATRQARRDAARRHWLTQLN